MLSGLEQINLIGRVLHLGNCVTNAIVLCSLFHSYRSERYFGHYLKIFYKTTNKRRIQSLQIEALFSF